MKPQFLLSGSLKTTIFCKTPIPQTAQIFASLLTLLLSDLAAAQPPKLMLAEQYHGQNVIGWQMSEKLDGVRAYWNGRQLISRQGTVFSPPPSFTRDFPPFALDGELYSGRGKFEQISAAVRKQGGDWRGIKLHVFDVPNAQGSLKNRLAQAQNYLAQHPNAQFVIVPQTTVQSAAHVQQYLHEIERLGGEGAMLHHPDAPYQAGRSSLLLKVKSAHDEECTVTQHHEGKGKYAGKLGAVSCKNARGEFKIGSGFKDADRVHPPKIGSVITYKYRGFTRKGLPRFATYLRQRN